jgi:methylated-DNA-[protein]-cysteine S-methyltransferase
MKYFCNYNYKFCNLFIAEDNGSICYILFKKDKLQNDFVKNETPLIKKTAKQLDEYFNGKRKVFELPLIMYGTDFQVKVWKALEKIPYGETRTYGEIAAMIGNPKASRAVGMANNRNPISIIVPCHRVIGCNNKLVGYGGGLELKQILLDTEKSQFITVVLKERAMK